ALNMARRALPAYSHVCSPKKFTQHQLFACLVLKNFLKTDYRGLAAHLADHPVLVQCVLELRCVPHYTTFQKASRRLLALPKVRKLLGASIRMQFGRRRRVKSSAADSTGLESTSASPYFVRRRNRVTGPWKTVIYHHYPKLGLLCDVRSHFILAARAGRGPRPDVDEFRPLIREALRWIRLARINADAGYDSEPNHRFAREEHGIRTLIPPAIGRPTDKPARGRYRRLMQVRFDRDAYHDRCQVETVVSMLKRRQGSHTSGRTHHSRCRDLYLMVLTHNAMILMILRVFYRACQEPIIDEGGRFQRSNATPRRVAYWLRTSRGVR
ncbi:MAG: transposase, partial [Gammaproteobacteria bacterium]